jgi:hypothetical protein
MNPLDTHPRALAIRDQALRRLSPAERLQLALEMTDTVRALARSRLRSEHPEWSEARLHRELLRIALLPAELPQALR